MRESGEKREKNIERRKSRARGQRKDGGEKRWEREIDKECERKENERERRERKREKDGESKENWDREDL